MDKHAVFEIAADPSTWPVVEQVPILHRFCAYLAATHIIRVGDNRRVAGSDMGDAGHYALAGYVDVFVSDDRLFKAIYELIPDAKPFRLMSSKEFCEAYLF